MQNRDEELLAKLQKKIAELKDRDYDNTSVNENIELLNELGLLLKHVVKDPTKLNDTLGTDVASDCWHGIARLLISNTMPDDFITKTKSSPTLQKQWHSFFGDVKWTPIIKSNLVTALRNDGTLKALLTENNNKNNAFFIAMQTQKHLTSIKPHLSSTRHGSAVAWIMQLHDELPDDPRFRLIHNIDLPDSASDEEITAFIVPYLNKGKTDVEGQPMRPDLFELIARLANGNLSFGKQAHVVSVFLSLLKPEDKDKIYTKLLGDLKNLADNKPEHRASLPLFKYTLPLTTFVLASMQNVKIVDVYFDWYTKKANKQYLLHIIQKHLDVFAPLLLKKGPKTTALDAIIDHQKSKFSGMFKTSTSHARKALNDILKTDIPLQDKPSNPRPT